MELAPDTLTLPILDELRLGVAEKRIGVLGGTFNPIHYGHIDMGIKARAEFGLSQVLFVVAGDPPHKRIEDIVPAKERFEMVELALEDMPGLWASDIELKRKGHTYTVDTMRILKAMHPDADFLFIVGEDSLHQFDTWRDFGQLCRMTEFLCFPRPGNYQEEAREKIKDLGERFDAVIHLSSPIKIEYEDVSSTRIRELVREGKSISGLVPHAVEEYINAAGLYL